MAKKQATEKVVFSYDRETREYTGEYQCQPDPMQKGSFLIPACATEIPPPEVLLFQCAVFDSGKWKIVPDYRGRKAVLLDSQQILEIRELGELPDDARLLSIDDEAELRGGKRARYDDDGNLEFFTPPPTKEQQIAALERELADSDWYVVRFAETGVPVPAEVSARRAEIRETISQLKGN